MNPFQTTHTFHRCEVEGRDGFCPVKWGEAGRFVGVGVGSFSFISERCVLTPILLLVVEEKPALFPQEYFFY